jgi:hypothetical protein
MENGSTPAVGRVNRWWNRCQGLNVERRGWHGSVPSPSGEEPVSFQAGPFFQAVHSALSVNHVGPIGKWPGGRIAKYLSRYLRTHHEAL